MGAGGRDGCGRNRGKREEGREKRVEGIETKRDEHRRNGKEAIKRRAIAKIQDGKDNRGRRQRRRNKSDFGASTTACGGLFLSEDSLRQIVPHPY